MTRYALVDQSGVVVNVIVWAGAEWLPPRNHYVIPTETANIGWTYNFDTKEFSPPVN